MNERENIGQEFEKRGKSNPFRTPDGYFETLEDRVMENIGHIGENQKSTGKIIKLAKPILGLVASFSLVYLLVYYPINYLLPRNTLQTEIQKPATADSFDAYSLSFSFIDENTLVNTLFSDDTIQSSKINPDEMLAYISTGLNEIEIYSEIQN